MERQPVQAAPLSEAAERRNFWIIGALSFTIPIVVAILLFMPEKGLLGIDVGWLPHFNAVLNSLTAVLLVVALYFIKVGKIAQHKATMLSAFILGSMFLVSYVLYHAQAQNTLYGDTNHDFVLSEAEKAAAGGMRTTYIALLLSHIVLAAIVVPFVLFSMYYSYTGRFEKHRKVSKYTWPIWFYVSVTGVLVYFMIAPFYNH